MVSEKDKKLLLRNHVQMVDTIDLFNSSLLNELVSRMVLTPRQLEDIKSARTNSAQVEKLLTIIPKKDISAFRHFIDALEVSGHEHVAELLRPSASNKHTNQEPFPGLPPQADSSKFRDVLRTCRVQLVEDMDTVPVLDHLIQAGILTLDNFEAIRACTTRRDQARFLLDLLDSRPPNAFMAFLEALHRTQPYLSDMLSQTMASLDSSRSTATPPKFTSLPTVHTVQQQQQHLLEKTQQLQQQQQHTSSLPEQQMAVGVSSPARPQGYAKELILGHVDEKYLCSECGLVLRNPMQSFCGHRFCSECIDYLLQSGQSVQCPSCQKENVENEYSSLQTDQKFPDNAIKRDFANLDAKCVNSGCDWKGKFRAYEKHERECAFKTAQCKCGQLIPRVQLADHVQNDCPQRTVRCPHCEQDVVFAEQEEHSEVCPKFPLTCESCGKANIPREKMEEHVDPERGDCTSPKVRCQYGCPKMVEVDKMEEHNQKAVWQHMEIIRHQFTQAVEMITDHQERLARLIAIETVPARVTRLEGVVEGLQSQGTSGSQGAGALGMGQQGGAATPVLLPDAAPQDSSQLTRKVLVCEQKTNAFEQLAAVLNRQMERAGKSVSDIERQRRLDRDLIESMDRKLRAHDRAMGVKDVALAEMGMRVQALEQISYDGTVTWKITEFSRRRSEAISGKMTSLYSPAFYTGRIGYKMCARIYLNGDGMGKGTHLSLFFVVMRGEYDALLSWPFKQKVTLSLLDQARKQDMVDAFRPDPTSSSFRRPTSDMNIASGCPLFMPLSLLEDSSRSYVKDDVIFVRVNVDSAEL